MSDAQTEINDSRAFPRLKLPPMYTVLRVRPVGHNTYPWTGHIYDISASGLRIELDDPIEPGTAVELRATLPGSEQTTITAQGRIVRIHDDEPGPTRLGLTFEQFPHFSDRQKLNRYLKDHLPKPAEDQDDVARAA